MKVLIKAALVGAGVAVALAGGPGVAAEHGEMDAIRAEIDSLRTQLERLEAEHKRMAMERKEAAPVVAGDQPGTWKLPGSDTSISFSGYVKADLAFDFKGAQGNAFDPTAIALKNTRPGEKNGNFGLTARQSRFRFDSRTPTEYGALRTRIETDFYGGGNVLRLRHAYGQLGPVLAGQTWSLFGDEDTSASTVDFNGPAGGYSGTRRAQIRYSQDVGGGVTAQIGIESGSGTILDAESTETLDRRSRTPNFVGALRYRGGWGAANLTSVLQKLETDEDSAIGTAVHLGAHVNVADGTRLLATFNRSRGAEGYIFGGGAAATQTDAGKLEPQVTMGGIVGLTQVLAEGVRSGVYYGWLEHDTNDAASPVVAATENESLRTLHANIWWSPVPRVNIGLEFMHGWRVANPQVDADGMVDSTMNTKGQESRIHAALQYIF